MMNERMTEGKVLQSSCSLFARWAGRRQPLSWGLGVGCRLVLAPWRAGKLQGQAGRRPAPCAQGLLGAVWLPQPLGRR
jgi:hypothetical protein